MSDFGTCIRVYIQEEKKGANTLRKQNAEKAALKPDELGSKCEEYLSRCDALQRKPTWQGLAGCAGVTSRTLNAWLREEGARSEILRKAADAISDRLQQRTDSMAVLSVKQPLYGGFLDKAQPGGGGDGVVNIVVTVEGRGETETAEFGK